MRDQIFISYSHRDARWLERLQVYLAPLERRGRVRRWDDTLIAPGQRWESEIAQALERTRVAILLVSADFLASEFIGAVELPRLLGVAENQGVLIFPVVLDHCNFDRFPELAQFQAIHPASEPLETLPESAQKAVLARLAVAVESALGAPAVAAPTTMAGRLIGLPARNPLFCGRDDTLAELATALTRTRSAALCGLPGIGKSELAIEFAYRHRSEYAFVCWCAAGSEAQILQGFGAIAATLRLPEATAADQGAAARAARDALAEQPDWLLVLDSAEDPALIRTWAPTGEQGHLLITSRSAATGSLAEPIAVEGLDDAEATGFLLRRSRIAADERMVDDGTRASAREVVRLTAGFPLALDQAGAYVEETGCGLEEYAQLWSEHSRQLLAERGRGGVRGDESLWQAWSMSLLELEAISPAAADLMRLYALLHPQALPESALAPGAALAGPVLAPVLGNALARNAALREALRLAFLRRDAKTRQLAMHAMVASFLRAYMDPPARRETTGRAVQLLDAIFPAPRFENWAQCDALAAHAAAVLDAATSEGVESPAAARLAAELAYYLAQRMRLAEALSLVERAVDWRRRFAPEPVGLARALMIAARIHADLADYETAGHALNEGLELLQAVDGAGLQRAHLLDRLAALAIDRGDYAAAEQGLFAARAQLQATAGGEHTIEAAQCANDEGVLAFRRGDYAQALVGFERASELRRGLLTKGHPALMWSIHNLAATCTRLGERERARSLYREVLAMREEALGADHPSVADTLLNLGLMDLHDRELALARTALERAVAIQLARRGPRHPDLASARAALADVALAEGRLAEAQALLDEVRQQRLTTLGAEHEFSARALAGLGRVALARGDLARAAVTLREALGVLTRHLGDSHTETMRCAADLAKIESAGMPPV